MRKPIMLNEALLKKLSLKMEIQEEDRLLKIKIIKETLGKLFVMKEYKDYKIRRNPESRLVLHALCSQEKCSEKVCYINIISFYTTFFFLAIVEMGFTIFIGHT